MNYRTARQRLYSLEHWGIKLGLDNIRQFCSRLGDPHRRYLTIHIAGTNGKGSTSAFIDSILRAAGYRVGRYTSPHLRDFRERIHVDGRPVSAQFVTRFVDRHWSEIRRERYSYFEVTTAMAFDAFAAYGIDAAVVEVGLGGRFDATNIVDPLVTVITRIARDHEHVLGRTAGKIAFEKAGIIKSGVPVVIGPLVPDAERRIRHIASIRNAPLWTAHELLTAATGTGLDFAPNSAIRSPLTGAHQRTNLAIALATTQVLHAQGLRIGAPAIRKGITSVRWPGRFQIAPGNPLVVYDAGHNPDGVSALVDTWNRVFGRLNCICVFNTRPDKNYEEMFKRLSAIVDRWVFCPMPDSPFIAKSELARLARTRAMRFEWVKSTKTAMHRARKLAKYRVPILVTGSHYLVGAVIPPSLLQGATDGMISESVTRAQLIAASQDRGAPF